MWCPSHYLILHICMRHVMSSAFHCYELFCMVLLCIWNPNHLTRLSLSEDRTPKLSFLQQARQWQSHSCRGQPHWAMLNHFFNCGCPSWQPCSPIKTRESELRGRPWNKTNRTGLVYFHSFLITDIPKGTTKRNCFCSCSLELYVKQR